MQMQLGVGLALPGIWSFFGVTAVSCELFGRASLILCTLESFQTLSFSAPCRLRG